MIDSPELLQLQKKTVEAVRSVEGPALEHWDEFSKFRLKEDQSPVTEVDTEIENTLRTRLAKLLPQAGFLVEEGKTELKDQYNWVIDPIDQTKNFVFRLPLFYIHVALLYRKEPILGVIYNPVTKQMFCGSKGNGVTLNDERLSIPNKTTGYVDVDFGSSDTENAWKIPMVERLAKAGINFRMTGGAYAPYILTGAISGFLVLNQHTKPMDQYTRMILMQELGLHCEWKNLYGRKILIVGQEEVYKQLNTIVESCITE